MAILYSVGIDVELWTIIINYQQTLAWPCNYMHCSYIQLVTMTEINYASNSGRNSVI